MVWSVRRVSLIILLVLVLVFTLINGQTEKVCHTEACKKTAERLLSYMDASVKPCDNFYHFACGNFLRSGVIPEDRTQNSSFIQVDEKLNDQLKSIVYEPSRTDEPHPYRTMKHMFSLCMDEDAINARGVNHALEKLSAAGGWPILGRWKEENWNFLDTEIKLRNLSIGGGSLFRISVSIDARNTTRRVIEVDQAGLELPREFLVRGEGDHLVKAYYNYMVDIAVMYGAERPTAKEQLRKSLLFEIELAKISVPQEQRRDYDRMYNPYGLQDLMKQMDWINWTKLLKNMVPPSVTLRDDELIVVNEVGFLKRLDTLLKNTPNEVVANHMMWHAAKDLSNILTNQMRERHLEYSRAVLGKIAREPRWKECVGVASCLSLALSSIYVKNFFDENSKKAALDMTERIRQEISRDIQEIDWMDDETKKQAEFKASRVVQHIGYPNELTNISKITHHYRRLKLHKQHYFEALLDMSRWANDYKFRQLRKPINKTDWRTYGNVAMVNAFYNPLANSMQFPAGILQQPFFNADVPNYINYATIGYIIAHEITHGFDDQGSQFDAEGDLKEWWGEESKTKFKEKTKCMIDQYAHFKENQTQLNLNGINTQGENVADNGGLKLSYRAYRRLTADLETPEPSLPGLQHYNNDQLFLLSMANMWCTNYRPEALKFQVTTGVHSPAEFRVNGPLMNMPEFSEIFQCAAEDPMNPTQKCAVW